ncbi:MAG TPA: acyltransferase [Kofleriaceae bacterium]|nr:acyltransferase [Kofleriaceae bacterium]
MADRSTGPAAPAAPSSATIPALDGVRGLAILLVLAHNLSPFEGGERWIDHWAGVASTFGWVGVQLFFVLSGYLISGILLDTRGAPGYYRGFFGRRVLRIFPLYYGFLVVCLIVLPALGLAPDRLLEDRDNQIWLWTYLINWAEPLGAGVAAFPHFWSLAVEEQFYLVWPLVVRRTTPRRLLKVAVAVAIIAFVSRLGLRLAGASSRGPYMFTICRMDALGLGGAVAAVMRIPEYREAAARWRARIMAGAGALFAAGLLATRGYPRTSFLDQTVGYTILAITCAVLVLCAVLDHERGRGWVGAVLRNPVLRSFGKYSYAIYLFHQPFNQMVGMPWLQALQPRGIGLKAGGAYMVGVTAVSYAFALASYHGFEKHFLALKRYFPAGRPAAPASSG